MTVTLIGCAVAEDTELWMRGNQALNNNPAYMPVVCPNATLRQSSGGGRARAAIDSEGITNIENITKNDSSAKEREVEAPKNDKRAHGVINER